jgi:hypothetical protein
MHPNRWRQFVPYRENTTDAVFEFAYIEFKVTVVNKWRSRIELSACFPQPTLQILNVNNLQAYVISSIFRLQCWCLPLTNKP